MTTDVAMLAPRPRGAVDNPIVDVVIPTRNRLNLLRDAVRSVRDQTFTDWRLIIVDDASDDGSADELRRIAEGDRRIDVALRSQQGGPQAARQTGFERSSAPFIALLDSDDVWRPTKLACQMARFDASPPEVGAVICWHDWVESDGRRCGDTRRPRPQYDVNPLFTTNMSTIVVRRATLAAVGGFLPATVRPLYTCEGIEFYLRLTHDCRFEVVQESLVTCRHHDGARANTHFTDGREAEELRYVVGLHRSRLAEYPSALATLRGRVAGRYLAAGRVGAGSRELLAAMRESEARTALRLLRRYGPLLVSSSAAAATARLHRGAQSDREMA